MKLIAQFSLCLMLTAGVFGQGFGLPPGKWWQIPRVVQMLELTQSQQDELDEVFRTAAPELIDLKAELEKATVALRGSLDRAEVDRSRVKSAASRVSQARSNLFERELMMLVDMRQVLSEPQWNRLRTALHERHSKMKDQRPADRRMRPPSGKRD